MSRECENCPHFGGFDEDGCPDCDLYTSFSACPYNAECPVKEEKQSDTAIKIEVDTEFLNLYIIETLQNTVKSVPSRLLSGKSEKLSQKHIRRKFKALRSQRLPGLLMCR